MLSQLKFTKKNLLKLRKRNYDEDRIYNSLLVCKSGKHHSGYASMLIVGFLNDNYDSLQDAEIAGENSDSIQWRNDHHLHLANDMHFQSGIIHFFSTNAKFAISGFDVSTIFIKLIKQQ